MTGYFKPVMELKWAEFSMISPYLTRKVKGPKEVGLRYERKMARFFEREFEHCGEVLHGQWIRFEDRYGIRYAQPDILIIPNDLALPIVIVEIKLTYKSHNVKQKLRQLYARLVEHFHPGRKLLLVQVFKRVGWQSVNKNALSRMKLETMDNLLRPDWKDRQYLLVHAL